MCGITGILTLKEPTGISRETLNRMIAVLHHRGPDESGLYLDDCRARSRPSQHY
jgi:asparagine synthase (glutamine-hydrolysing)